MNKFIKHRSLKAAFLFVALALTGCATSVIKVGRYEGLSNSNAKEAKIFVYRESSFVGAANQYDVLMDSVLVGSVPNGSFFTVDAKSGNRSLNADTHPFGKGTNIDVEAGKSYCVKLTLNFCFSCKSADITPVNLDQCETEIKSLTKVSLK
jgi:hypothetical protein